MRNKLAIACYLKWATRPTAVVWECPNQETIPNGRLSTQHDFLNANEWINHRENNIRYTRLLYFFSPTTLFCWLQLQERRFGKEYSFALLRLFIVAGCFAKEYLDLSRDGLRVKSTRLVAAEQSQAAHTRKQIDRHIMTYIRRFVFYRIEWRQGSGYLLSHVIIAHVLSRTIPCHISQVCLPLNDEFCPHTTAALSILDWFFAFSIGKHAFLFLDNSRIHVHVCIHPSNYSKQFWIVVDSSWRWFAQLWIYNSGNDSFSFAVLFSAITQTVRGAPYSATPHGAWKRNIMNYNNKWIDVTNVMEELEYP
jgi:hypothetical protein